VAVSSTPQSNGPVVPFSGDSIKKEIRPSTKSERGSVSHDSYGPSKCSDQNRLKVRIKVGSDNVLARNNAAIYSGLGLDISSPSSNEDSPDGRGSLSPEVNNVPHESPQTILQVKYSRYNTTTQGLYTSIQLSIVKRFDGKFHFNGRTDHDMLFSSWRLPVIPSTSQYLAVDKKGRVFIKEVGNKCGCRKCTRII
jgi:hypothetical protein